MPRRRGSSGGAVGSEAGGKPAVPLADPARRDSEVRLRSAASDLVQADPTALLDGPEDGVDPLLGPATLGERGFRPEGRRYKMIRGMGSLSAMQDGSADRYFQEGEMAPSKLVPEGIEGRVPYKGPVADVIFQMVGGLRSGMGYCGVSSIPQLQCEVEMVQITSAGLRESHPHDVTITREAPNYSA